MIVNRTSPSTPPSKTVHQANQPRSSGELTGRIFHSISEAETSLSTPTASTVNTLSSSLSTQPFTPSSKNIFGTRIHPLQVSSDPAASMNLVCPAGVPEKFLVSRAFSEIGEYWSMIVNNSVDIGISLTPLKDKPSSYPLIIDQWKISCIDATGDNTLLKRLFKIELIETGQTRTFEHLTFSWQDMGVPSPENFKELMMNYLSLIEPVNNPLVHLHCTGGHGRSGTFLLARALMSQPDQSHAEQLLSTLRLQRSKLVETKKQFEFAIDQAELYTGKQFVRGAYKSKETHQSKSKETHQSADSSEEERQFFLETVKKWGSVLESGSSEQRSDREIVLAAVTQDGEALRFAAPELQIDREIVLAAVTQNGAVLQHLSPELRADREIVLAAVTQNGMALIFAADKLQLDREIALAALTRDGMAPRSLKDMALAAVIQNGAVLQHLSSELRADRDIVLAAVAQDSRALPFAAPELQTDRAFIIEAVRCNGAALEFASPQFQADKEVVFQATAQNGRALAFASVELQADKEVVLAAVTVTGSALQFASPELQADREIAMVSIMQAGGSLAFADPELRADEEIVLTACKQDRGAIKHAASHLQQSPLFMQAYLRKVWVSEFI